VEKGLDSRDALGWLTFCDGYTTHEICADYWLFRKKVGRQARREKVNIWEEDYCFREAFALTTSSVSSTAGAIFPFSKLLLSTSKLIDPFKVVGNRPIMHIRESLQDKQMKLK
jgi:hypothetical protein